MDGPEPTETPTAFNLPLNSHMPENWTPLECVVVVECLDEEGTKRLYIAETDGISTWSTAGALQAAADAYRDDLREILCDHRSVESLDDDCSGDDWESDDE